MKRVLSILLGSILLFTITGCGSEETKDASEKIKEYYCETGTLNGENCEVVETEEATQTCNKDYKLTDGKCVKTTATNAQVAKTCGDGYEFKNGNCISKTGVDRELVPACRGGIQEKFAYDAERNYYYRSIRAEEGKCIVQICKNSNGTDCYEDYVEGINELACPNGTKEINGKCYKTSKVKTTYSCKTGKLNGSKCTVTDTQEVTNTCKTEGFTYNAESRQCEKVTITQALEK